MDRRPRSSRSFPSRRLHLSTRQRFHSRLLRSTYDIRPSLTRHRTSCPRQPDKRERCPSLPSIFRPLRPPSISLHPSLPQPFRYACHAVSGAEGKRYIALQLSQCRREGERVVVDPRAVREDEVAGFDEGRAAVVDRRATTQRCCRATGVYSVRRFDSRRSSC